MNKWLKTGCVFVICAFFLLILPACRQEESLTKVKVAEVTHSIFYTPLYVAEAKGFFKRRAPSVTSNNMGRRQNDDIAFVKRV